MKNLRPVFYLRVIKSEPHNPLHLIEARLDRMHALFVTSTPMNVEQGSGTFVGIETLTRSLGGLGWTINLVTPKLHLPVYTAERVVFNEALRFRQDLGEADLMVGFGLGENGHYSVGGHVTIHDDEPIGDVTTAGVLARSSNICTAKMAFKAGGGPALESFFRKVGLYEKPNIELPQNELGRPRTPTKWKDVTTATVSFGHRTTVSLSPRSVARRPPDPVASARAAPYVPCRRSTRKRKPCKCIACGMEIGLFFISHTSRAPRCNSNPVSSG